MILEAVLAIAVIVVLGFVLRNVGWALLFGGLLAIGVSYFWLHTLMTLASLIGAVSICFGLAYAKVKLKL